ncbi:MAG: M28 family peptidase [Acidobacteria bacterium]|nr:MAG: M28 family peptidase [Acidobacteriota bacterium]
MGKSALVAIVLALTSACAQEPTGPIAVKDLPNIDANLALADIKKLASDEFEGRAPGSKGEDLTVQYLTEQFKAAGLEPGNPDGTWTQAVPLVSLTPTDISPLVVTGKGGKTHQFKIRDEFVPFSRRVTDKVALAKSDLVFVGYGVQAPEYKWDDFAGIDVKGKTIVVLVNDPQVTLPNSQSLDPAVFNGSAMTYYGRWTYKFDHAAELGAAGVIIVHETPTAGYPFTVVQGFGAERFNLVTPNKNADKAMVESWISLDAARELFKMAGMNYDAEKTKAATRGFKPVAMNLTASVNFTQKMRTVDSRNVVAKLPGSDPKLKDEYVIFSAHWDHFGIGEPVNGDKIYNGAQDNASGTAGILAIARAMKQVKPAPKRSILFLAVTSEEQGLLGSEYYGKFPLYPLDKTLADINVDDNLSLIGRTSDTIVIGLGASDLDDYLRDAAAELGKSLKPDAEPEKGFYYRSDHFNFAKVGVPALDAGNGDDVIGKPAGYGRQKKDDYTAHLYHSPQDQVSADWDLTGYAEDAKLLFAVGYRVAQADKFPEWKAGNEFKAIRDKSMKK